MEEDAAPIRTQPVTGTSTSVARDRPPEPAIYGFDPMRVCLGVATLFSGTSARLEFLLRSSIDCYN